MNDFLFNDPLWRPTEEQEENLRTSI